MPENDDVGIVWSCEGSPAVGRISIIRVRNGDHETTVHQSSKGRGCFVDVLNSHTSKYIFRFKAGEFHTEEISLKSGSLDGKEYWYKQGGDEHVVPALDIERPGVFLPQVLALRAAQKKKERDERTRKMLEDIERERREKVRALEPQNEQEFRDRVAAILASQKAQIRRRLPRARFSSFVPKYGRDSIGSTYTVGFLNNAYGVNRKLRASKDHYVSVMGISHGGEPIHIRRWFPRDGEVDLPQKRALTSDKVLVINKPGYHPRYRYKYQFNCYLGGSTRRKAVINWKRFEMWRENQALKDPDTKREFDDRMYALVARQKARIIKTLGDCKFGWFEPAFGAGKLSDTFSIGIVDRAVGPALSNIKKGANPEDYVTIAWWH